MKRASLAFIWLTCLAFQARGTDSPWQTLPQKISNLRKSVVHIVADGTVTGTGFVISANGYIITATHVVQSREPYNDRGRIQVDYTDSLDVEFFDGKHLPAKAIANTGQYTNAFDISLLKVSAAGLNALTLDDGPVADGSTVYFMGFPLSSDLPNAVTYTGTVASQYTQSLFNVGRIAVEKKMIQVQAPIAKGFSGSPLLNYETGKVIGVIDIKIGGINDQLEIAKARITENRKHILSITGGIDQGATFINLIDTLDRYLSAGSGSAVSIHHIYAFAQDTMLDRK